MKKVLLILLCLVSVAFGQERIKVAPSSSPSDNILTYLTVTGRTNLFVPGNGIIGGSLTVSNSFIGLGAINTLVNQTLTGDSSIVTRGLGDSRYFASSSTNQFVATNNTVFVNALTNGTVSGTGYGLLSGIANRTFTLKDLIAGAGMSFTSNGNSVTLTSTASGGGDVFTSSNNTFVVTATNTFNGGLLTSNLVVRGSVSIGTNSPSLKIYSTTAFDYIEETRTNLTIYTTVGDASLTSTPVGGRVLLSAGGNTGAITVTQLTNFFTIFSDFSTNVILRGGLQIIPGATAGHVWTSTNSAGMGAWQAPSGGSGVQVTNQSWTLTQSTTLTANTFSNLVSLTTLTNRGTVNVSFSCYITLSSAQGGQALARVSCGSTNWDNPRIVANLPSGTDDNVLVVNFTDTLSGAPKTYDFKIASNGANVVPITSTVAGQTTTNSTRAHILHWY